MSWHTDSHILRCEGFQVSTVHSQVYQRSYSQIGHIPPKMSDKFKSQHSLSPTIIVVGGESGYLKIFFTFLEVNMSNIL